MHKLSLKFIEKGFTIIELVVVIAVIAILAAITIVGYGSVKTDAQFSKMQSDYKKIESAISTYEAKNGRFPRCATDPVVNECPLSDLVANLNTSGLETYSPDGTTPIRYVVGTNGPDSYNAWAVRFISPKTKTWCKQGFNYPSSWWGSVTTPDCW